MNFKTGNGKSPSFFFYTENKKFMIKTLKPSEMSILFSGKENFLQNYFEYLQMNKEIPKDSLLMKIMGVYELHIGDDRQINILITENMIGQRENEVFRVYDLKGSLFQRETALQDYQKINGTGS